MEPQLYYLFYWFGLGEGSGELDEGSDQVVVVGVAVVGQQLVGTLLPSHLLDPGLHDLVAGHDVVLHL